ncbi:ParB/RepB/Spo0J family partition protein [Oceanospirillaceae bacterium]|jgi:ParB family transcriptional regulator, chromosome partitioning protein|nr:ParB/RepB/Spo0J family partition protein [Oceanospirillaceae bacterium]|tara:strand:- start:1359 stop:2234 length:876 start_codon:yes stop_codon:yes gene_type:complete
MVKKRGLNRGLQALLQGAGSLDVDLTQTQTDSKDGLQDIPIEWMQRGAYQPRRDMDPDALEELASSIRVHGIMQPIVVRSVGIDRYEIIAGERRWRAAQLAQLDSVPALIKEVPDEAAIAMALIENIQREDLNAIEEAFALQRLQSEFELTQQEVAHAVGKSRSAIANLLRLLQLSEPVRLMLERGDLEMGHARSLLTLEGELQLQLAREVVAKGLSVRQTEELVRKAQQTPHIIDKKQVNPDTKSLQNRLSESLGAEVSVLQSAKGKGKLTIAYDTLDQLDGIIARLEHR